MEKHEDLEIEKAELVFRNFSGKEGRFNTKGDRNFCVLINHDDAEALKEEGWAIKYLKPRDPDDDPIPYMKVNVSYKYSKPMIWLITEVDGVPVKKTKLTENEIDVLDFAEIKNVDMTLSPYHYEMPGRSGISAYLKVMYVTIKEDKFAGKYLNVPESAMSIITED